MPAQSRVLQLCELREVRGAMHRRTRPCVHRDQALSAPCNYSQGCWERTQENRR